MTALVVVSTGIARAIVSPAILDRLGVRDDRARGFALGVAAHAIGTARSFQLAQAAGAFATVGMILNAIATVFLAPIALPSVARI